MGQYLFLVGREGVTHWGDDLLFSSKAWGYLDLLVILPALMIPSGTRDCADQGLINLEKRTLIGEA